VKSVRKHSRRSWRAPADDASSALRFVAVMFTDIKDSTVYFSRAGDLAGRLRVRQHDELLHPIVTQHEGEVVAHTGDGMLAVFTEPNDCCRAAIAMQQSLARHNSDRDTNEPGLHVRIAGHAGVGVREAGNVFGTVVNAAARIEGVAQPDEILVSGALYAHLDESLRERCRFVQERELRGTGQVHRLYEVVWDATAASPPTSDDATSRPAVHDGAARSSITALYVDAEASTELRNSLGTAADIVIDRYVELVRRCVAEYGGRVERVAGDTVAALFDTADLACAAAVALQRAIAGEPWDAHVAGAPALRVRVGIHAAEGDEGPRDVIARAARLSSAAHGGQVLMTADAHGDVCTAVPATVTLRSYGARVLQDERFTERIVEIVVPDVPRPDPVLRTAPARPSRAGVQLERDASRRTSHDLLAEVAGAIRGERDPLLLDDRQAQELARTQPCDLEQYFATRALEWSQPRYQLDTRFVQLTMLIDRGEDAEDERWRASERVIEDVREMLADPDEPAVVVLGAPGAGKSTILRRLELDAATAGLRHGDGLVTFFVPLNQYRPDGDALPEPARWLHEAWAVRYPDLPPLEELERDGRACYVLDGLNEMQTPGTGGFRDAVRQWKAFVERTVERSSGNRIVFSCRSLDYSASLSSAQLRVPQVHVEPMSDTRVRQYLKLYSPAHWVEVWEEIHATTQLDLFRSPFFLKLLVDEVEAQGAVPKGRAALFTGFVRRALARELERDNPIFDDDAMLDARDRRQVITGTWAGAHALPRRGALVPMLEKLAYTMQAARHDDDVSQVRVDIDDALAILDHPHADAVLAAGAAVGILDESAADEVLYTHQLVQEYFAAREMATRLDVAMLARPWRRAEIDPPLAAVLAALGTGERLPALPTTGWEETTKLAAAMAADPDQFVRAVADVDLVLAGRCAAEPELEGRVSASLVGELRDALATRARTVDADLRARIDAGLTLGVLGGPPFERHVGDLGPFLLPPTVAVDGGDYVIGADEPYEYRGRLQYEETPACEVRLAPFAIGKFAVTNGEWGHFIAGGGYDDDRFWEGDAARAWRRGEGTAVNVRNLARYWRTRFVARPELVEIEYENDRMDTATYELWHRRMRMDDAQFERHLATLFPEVRYRAPRYWHDPRFNNPMQPVIGISCFEARAYTAWLAAQSGLPFRLPTEAEWEAAARGRARRRFAYGDAFDPRRGNTIETHLRLPTPVGAFPEGDTPTGIADLTGNTYDLTSSLWGHDPIETAWPYPYDSHDGRESPEAPITVSRVGRGGAWYLGEVHARASYRGRDRYDLRPDDWLNYRGCRVALSRDE
jgi:class 3 adenylate cyclase/formylglycine-generating enzyme required for sulfatase activity